MKTKLLGALLIVAMALAAHSQETNPITKVIRIPAKAGSVKRQLELGSLPGEEDLVRWRAHYSSKRIGEWNIIAPSFVGLSKDLVGTGYLATVQFPWSGRTIPKFDFDVYRTPEPPVTLTVASMSQSNITVNPGAQVMLLDATLATTGEVKIANSGILVQASDASLAESAQLWLNGTPIGTATTFVGGQAWVGSPFSVSGSSRISIVVEIKTNVVTGSQVQLSLKGIRTESTTQIIGLPLSGAIATVTLVTNWSTETVSISVSPLDPQRAVYVQAGQTNCLFAAVRISGNGVFTDIRWEQTGIMWEGEPQNVLVSVIDSTGGSTTLTTTQNGRFFTAHTASGIPFDGYIDVAMRGKIPIATVPGRYVLPALRTEADVSIKDPYGLRLHLIPTEFAPQNPYTSEFCPDADPVFFGGAASIVHAPP